MTRTVSGTRKMFSLGVVVLLLSGVGSYTVAHNRPRTPPVRPDSLQLSTTFPTGLYLLAYVVVASDCGFCTEPQSKRALANFRDSLVKANSSKYAAVRVIGVSIDHDLEAGVKYLERYRSDLPMAFDQIMVGGSWLNEFMVAHAWRDHRASVSVPQVLFFKRHVDARAYPKEIGVSPDTLVFQFTGRDSLLAFVNGGGKLPK